MKKIPSLLIVTDRGNFHAYQSTGQGGLTKVDMMQISEALEKLSDQVTDQAGSFPSSESLGQGSSTGENLPLKEELELRSIRQIGLRIEELIAGQSCDTWGLVAASEINNAILEQVTPQTRDKLTLNLKRNLTHETPQQLLERVAEADAS